MMQNNIQKVVFGRENNIQKVVVMCYDRHRAEVQQKIVNEAYGDSVSRRYGTQQPTEKSGNKKIVS